MTLYAPRRPGDGVPYLGSQKISARIEKLCRLILRMEQAQSKKDFRELASEFSAIRAYVLARKCERLARQK